MVSGMLSNMKSRGQWNLKQRIQSIVPDLEDQYTHLRIEQEDRFVMEKLRCQHTFQVGLASKAVSMCSKSSNPLKIVDIGDSSGTHLKYLSDILNQDGIPIETLSVNLDPVAVEKIQARGMKAILCRAEELHTQEGIETDLFLSFEMLEHLMDPAGFLYSMSKNAHCQYLAITVPYVQTSRIGLHHLRQNWKRQVYAENTHIFELSPEDWELMFRFSGWKVVHEDFYTQYPEYHPLFWTRYLWRKMDFDGFYGAILKQSSDDSEWYQDW